MSSVFAADIHHDFLNIAAKKIEYYWAAPQGNGPFPAIIYIHDDEIAGGKYYVDNGVLIKGVKSGYVTVAISQSGFGESSGPSDFSGSGTQDSLLAIIDLIKSKPFVSKIVLYGEGRGAIAAGMVASRSKNLSAMVLVSGFYDIEDAMTQFELRGQQTYLKKIKDEIGVDSWRFYQRSVLYHSDKIKVPTLMLNGADDERSVSYHATELAHLLNAINTEARSVIFPNIGHEIPDPLKEAEIIPFLKKQLYSKTK